MGEREQIMQQRLEAEQRRAQEAREALVELMSEVEGMSSTLEAEKARAGSLGAALGTTREMLSSLKAQAAERGQALQDATRRAQEAERAARELSAGLQATRQEAQLQEERATKELDAARQVVEKLSGRISFLEQEVTAATDLTFACFCFRPSSSAAADGDSDVFPPIFAAAGSVQGGQQGDVAVSPARTGQPCDAEAPPPGASGGSQRPQPESRRGVAASAGCLERRHPASGERPVVAAAASLCLRAQPARMGVSASRQR